LIQEIKAVFDISTMIAQLAASQELQRSPTRLAIKLCAKDSASGSSDLLSRACVRA
jgi:hypothetical protein